MKEPNNFEIEDLKKSIVESLDGYDIELIPYLPYILQDLWEIGADPLTMLTLIKNNINIESAPRSGIFKID
ncbi:MAG: hypothetical protein U1C46_02215 [Bacteroidales bacterium]|nr:hypothetical protein [Bacteroidales bacterium]MDZ4203610.1 hypothetical protein [Bacteroidales bacterium]